MSHLRELILASHATDVEVRQDLHRHPELGYNEVRTSSMVRSHLEGAHIEHHSGIAGGTGVLAYLPATTDPATAPTVALRADMDALPILEDTGLEYQSETPGIMHACGHDGHTTILIATARALSKLPERPNNVLFLFQPAEEGGAGGKKMCEEGVLAGKIAGNPADVIFGLHGNPWVPLGQVSTRVGPIMASANEMRITVTGKGSHAAYPHLGIDPILIASHIVVALQSIAARNIDPLDSVVITVGQIEAGVAHNVIPETAHMHGTVRTLRNETFTKTAEHIRSIVTNIATALGGSAEVNFLTSYPVTENHPGATAEFRRVATSVLGDALVHEEKVPSMGAEDFSFYGHEVPACFFFLGLRGPEHATYPNLHAPQFNFNDAAIPTGVELFCNLALAAR